MGSKTSIEWTRSADGSPGATWTPIRARNRATGKVGWHCIHKSHGCKFCYSERDNKRFGTGLPFKPGHEKDIEIFLDEKMLRAPLSWKKPRMIFVCSMTDLFADFVKDEWIDSVFAVMALCRQHTFQCLTKRPKRMREYLSKPGRAIDELALAHLWEHAGKVSDMRVLPNVWLGTSCEDQTTADERIPDLMATPAAVRFVSAEPLLGPIDFERISCPNGCSFPNYCNVCAPDGGTPTGTFDALGGGELHWIISGGESGPHARPMHPQWARDIRDACAASGVAYFHKQNGEWAPGEIAGQNRRSIRAADWFYDRWEFEDAPPSRDGDHIDDEPTVFRVGRARAGRQLDGRTHDEMPGGAHAD